MHHFSCCFCESNTFEVIATKAFHKKKKDHGPFAIYKCEGCDSLVTHPLPSDDQLKILYGSFKGGIDPRLKLMREQSPLLRWYTDCIDNARLLNKDVFRKENLKWLDAGGGNGELARLLLENYPKGQGVVADFNKQPSDLMNIANLSWHETDLNKSNWIDQLGTEKFDAIFSIAVLEHVKYPNLFLKQLINSLSIGGMLFVITPDQASFASRTLRKRWPYYLPGEHLHVATRRGLSKWFQKIQQESDNSFKARVDSITIRYPLQYLLRFFHLNVFARLFSANRTLRVRPGLLQLIITRRK